MDRIAGGRQQSTKIYSKKKFINKNICMSRLATSGRAQSARHTSSACATLGRHLIVANSLAKGAIAGLWDTCGCTVLAWQPLPHSATMYTIMGGAIDRSTCKPGTFTCYCFERVISPSHLGCGLVIIPTS